MAKIKKNYESVLSLTHDLIGGKWRLLILWHIRNGNNRFSLLERAIPDISPKVLTSQLREMVDSSILIRTVIDDNPPKVIIYQLNEEYQEIELILEIMHQLITKYVSDHDICIRNSNYND